VSHRVAPVAASQSARRTSLPAPSYDSMAKTNALPSRRTAQPPEAAAVTSTSGRFCPPPRITFRPKATATAQIRSVPPSRCSSTIAMGPSGCQVKVSGATRAESATRPVASVGRAVGAAGAAVGAAVGDATGDESVGADAVVVPKGGVGVAAMLPAVHPHRMNAMTALIRRTRPIVTDRPPCASEFA
jgi:hypothetical protein